MGIFRKQTVRAPWTTVLQVLLLALSIAASSIGFAAWTGANKQFEEIDRQYTTIGIHAGLECGLLSQKIPEMDMISIGPNMYDIHTPKEKMSLSSGERVCALVLDMLKRIH